MICSPVQFFCLFWFGESLYFIVDNIVSLPPCQLACSSLRDLAGAEKATGMEALCKSFRTLQGSETWSCLGSWSDSNPKPNIGAPVQARLDLVSKIKQEEVKFMERVRDEVGFLDKPYFNQHTDR